jgi:hypothetical protein
MQAQRWGYPTAFTHHGELSLNHMQTAGKQKLQRGMVCCGFAILSVFVGDTGSKRGIIDCLA